MKKSMRSSVSKSSAKDKIVVCYTDRRDRKDRAEGANHVTTISSNDFEMND